ncbi:hypothetical protein PoB_002958900 [Plakobranchus ocellatus]|uniref:EGF-like domain-containing protein n=1 Tax=Plakobranchus ocellatus TaxID=259542 RepID=A0AAV4A9C7_9GAST|nr:hypothetical protein PoB_002958900 [Plakobranchus ocellatus]
MSDAEGFFRTREIPQTEDNSMRALADFATPMPTSRGQSDDKKHLRHYHDGEDSDFRTDRESQPNYWLSKRPTDFYRNIPWSSNYYYYEETDPAITTTMAWKINTPMVRVEESTRRSTTVDLPNNTLQLMQANSTALSPFEPRKMPENTNTSVLLNAVIRDNSSIDMPSSTNLSTSEHSSIEDIMKLDYVEATECDPETHFRCDVIHFERCDIETRKCRCLNGYLRDADDTGSCHAANFYHGHVTMGTSNPDRKYSVKQMNSIRLELLQKANNVFLIAITIYQIRQLFKMRNISGVLDISINSYEAKDQELDITFDLSINKALVPEMEDMESLWKDLTMLPLSEEPQEDLQDLPATNYTANSQRNGFKFESPLIEINQCSQEAYHHCSPLAQCLYESPKVTCRCQPGFEDAALDLHRLPGEVCIEKCNCRNGGICLNVDEVRGTKQCRAAKSRMFHFAPEPNILKLPRVWMDTTSFHADLSPQNPRRMSMASGADCNEYFGGFILEDLAGPNIQRHADALTSYYQTTANLCGVPSTSQQSLYRY